MEISYGNRSGQYFTEWRFDLLRELLQLVSDGPNEAAKKIAVNSPTMWYDETTDFHKLKFVVGTHTVEVRFYKVFSCVVDGADFWIGCPRSAVYNLAGQLRKFVNSQERGVS